MRLAPVDLYDAAAQQAWLEDLAARGLFLSAYRRGGAWASFQKGEPKTVRYRLEPVGSKDEWLPPDRRDAYGTLGWNHVTTIGNAFHVWRCDDPAAPELDTDPEVRAMAYGYQVKRMRRQDLLVAVLFLLPVAVWLWLEWSGRGSLYSWWPLWRAVVLGVSGLLACGEALRERWAFHRFVRELKSGVAQPQRRPYRLAQGMTALVLVMWVGLFSVWLAGVLEPRSRPYQPVESFEEGVPCVDLGPGEQMALPWENWHAAEQWWVVQKPEMGGQVQSYYLRFWTEGQAVRRVRQVLDHTYEAYGPVTVNGTDEAWQALDGERQFLLLRWDKQVLNLYAAEGLDLTPYLDDYVELLARFP